MPTATPLFQKVLPDGSVLFDFNGHIAADGVDLQLGDSSQSVLSPDRSVNWLTSNDVPANASSIRGRIITRDQTPHNDGYVTQIQAGTQVNIGAQDFARLEVKGKSISGGPTSQVSITVATPSGNPLQPTDVYSINILDSSNTSDFLRLGNILNLPNMAVNAGIANIVWNGTTGSNITLVGHGLGDIPIFYLAGLVVWPGQNAWAWINGVSATQLTVIGRNTSGIASGATTPFGWIAIGAKN